MADCELLSTCLFFNDQMREMPATSEVMKGRYCRADNSQCARFMVYQAVGRSRVPGDLPPSDIERARRIITRLTS